MNDAGDSRPDSRRFLNEMIKDLVNMERAGDFKEPAGCISGSTINIAKGARIVIIHASGPVTITQSAGGQAVVTKRSSGGRKTDGSG